MNGLWANAARLLALCAALVWGSPRNVALLVADLSRALRCGCVFLLLESTHDLKSSLVILEIQKILPLSTGIVPYSKFQDLRLAMHCSARPLFVLSSSSNITQHFLSNISHSLEWGLTAPLKYEVWYTGKPSKPVWLLTHMPPVNFFHGIDVPFDCEFIVGKWSAVGVAQLSEVYRVLWMCPLVELKIGYWASGSGLVLEGRGFYHRRSDLQGIEMLAAVQDNNPFTIVRMYGKSAFMFGYTPQIWIVLMEKMNFTTRLAIRFDKSLQGIQGLVLRQEVYLAVMQVAVTKFWSYLISFTAPLQFSRYRLYIRYLGSIGLDRTGYVAPFSARLWLACGVLMLVTSICLAMVFVKQECLSSSLLLHAMLTTMGIFCSQGQASVPQCSPSRLTLVASFLCIVIITSLYSGQLVAFLTSRMVQLPFRDLEGLRRDPTYRLQVVWGSPEQNFIMTTNDPLFKSFQDSVAIGNYTWKNTPLPMSYFSSLSNVCFKDVVALVQEDYAISYAASLACDIMTLPDFSIHAISALPIKKNSPFLGLLNHNINKMRRAGLLHRLLSTSLYRLIIPMEEVVTSIDLHQVTVLVWLLVAGSAIAFTVLGLEVLHHHKRKACTRGRHVALRNIVLKAQFIQHDTADIYYM